jgi:predicted metal-binding protein
MPEDTIFVCNRCRASRENKERDGRRGGEHLYKAVQTCVSLVRIPILVKSVECLSACDRYCAVAFRGPGKVTWMFGDLSSEVSELEESVTAIKAFAVMYCASHDGFFERKERPPLLQVGILARIPPLHALHERPWKISGQETGKVMD